MKFTEKTMETALIESKTNKIGIYQLKEDTSTAQLMFLPFKEVALSGSEVKRENYKLVYVESCEANITYGDIFYRFNMDHPSDFTGRSLSISDIVVMKRDGEVAAYYVDQFEFGFTFIENFLGSGVRIGKEQIEDLAKKIRQFLIDNKLWQDVAIYFNGKGYSTVDDSGNHFYNNANNLVVLEDVDPHCYFEYVADPHILSMSFEGPFCGCLNYYNEYGADFDNRIQNEFSKILDKYGLFYELGEHWNLSCYESNPIFTTPRKNKQEVIRVYADPTKTTAELGAPSELIHIQLYWKDKANAYGDKGSSVLGAGFSFTYKEQKYFMPPLSKWQGSLSWESFKGEIEDKLIKCGATDIVYEWGHMD